MYKIASDSAQRRVSAVLPKHMPAAPVNLTEFEERGSLVKAVMAIDEKLRDKAYDSSQERDALIARKAGMTARIVELNKSLGRGKLSPLDPRAVERAFVDVANAMLPRHTFAMIMAEARKTVREAADKIDVA